MAELPAVKVAAGLEDTSDDSLVPGIITCSVVCGVVAISTAVLRIHARFAGTGRLMLNDWLFIVALCFFLPYNALFSVINIRSEGKGMVFIKDPVDAKLLGVFTLLNENFYAITMAANKFSILTIYDATFSSRNFYRCLILIGLFTTAWFTAVIVVTNIQCVPLERTWNLSEGGWCLQFDPFMVTTSGLNILGSLALLAIPVPMVLQMDLSRRKQILILVAFAVGGATCAIGVVRFAFTLRGDSSKNSPGSNTLAPNIITTIELTFGLLCASLPTYSYFFPGFNTPVPRKRYIHGGTQHLRPREQSNISTRITGGQTLGPRRSGIAVTDDISMMTHANVDGAWVRVPDEDERALYPLAVYSVGWDGASMRSN